MFSIDDPVVYGSTGVCRIVDIRREKFGSRTDREYYVLQPVYGQGSTLYVPTDSPNARMRNILTEAEVHELIEAMPDITNEWIGDDQVRKALFQEILQTCDQRGLIRLIRTVHRRRSELTEKGKGISSGDAESMKAAERLLQNEFALALDIAPDQVVPYIVGQVRT